MIHGNGCGKPAYEWVGEPPVCNQMLRAASVRHLDGTPCVAGEELICGSCGQRMSPVLSEWVVEWAVGF